MVESIRMFAAGQRLSKSDLLCSRGLSTAFCFILFYISTGLAQESASPITPSGLNTQVSDPTSVAGRTQYNITGGTRAGPNVFHSFWDFNVPTSMTANFLNDTGTATSNILGRVTSGNGSSIFGAIHTTGFGQANLFLMNPAGVIVGPKASLNVGGSITFTTADYLRLGGDGRFSAIPSAAGDALLSTHPVTAYGFVQANAGAITIEGSQLKVSEGKGISLVGGNVTIQSSVLTNGTVRPASLSGPGGQINFVSTASPGEVLTETFDYAPNVKGQSFAALGTIQISHKSVVDSSGSGGGTVLIRGGRFTIDDSRISANVTDSTPRQLTGPNIDIHLSQDATMQGPAILETNVALDVASGSNGVLIEADRISIRGVPGSIADFGRLPFTGIRSGTQGSGHAGNIILRSTGNIDITNVVNLESTSGFDLTGNLSDTPAAGNSGNIQLTSRHGNIQMIEGGGATIITSQTGTSSGKTGKIMASAVEGDITLNGANFFTALRNRESGGQGGHVEITARNLWMNSGLLSIDNEGPLKPGGISVELSNTLTMENGSVIATSSINDAPAADITLTANDIVTTQGSIINNATFASGPGGHLKIIADRLQVTDGAQLSSGSTRAPSRGNFPQNISPSGTGGNITIQSLGPRGSILIDGGGSGIFAEAEGTGPGGNISLRAGTSISVSTGGRISASSTGAGNAGSISIDAGQELELRDGSSIITTTESAQANGGNIEIRAIDLVRLVNKSEISTSVKGAEGNGGNIFIDPQVVVLQGSNVSAQAVGGAGGTMTFVTPLFLADSASIVSASSERGPSGTVTIQSPTSNISGTVGHLTAKPSPAQVLVQNYCAAKPGNGQSTFLLTSRDSLPDEPGGWLNTQISVDHWTGEDRAQTSGLMVRKSDPNRLPTMAKQSSNPAALSLRQLTPPGFLVRSFTTGSTGCPS
jgi:filamentous hemagglutinin family protein